MTRLILALLLTGCTFSPGPIPPPTKPPAPSLRTVAIVQVHTTMSQLAGKVLTLEELLQSSTTPTPADRDRAVELLRSMEADAGSLTPEQIGVAHPGLVPELVKFRTQLREAADLVASDASKFKSAGDVTGACTRCHENRL